VTVTWAPKTVRFDALLSVLIQTTVVGSRFSDASVIVSSGQRLGSPPWVGPLFRSAYIESFSRDQIVVSESSGRDDPIH
jgi:hypothetical protein